MIVYLPSGEKVDTTGWTRNDICEVLTAELVQQ